MTRYETLAEVLAACSGPEARRGAEAAMQWVQDRMYRWAEDYKSEGLDRVFVEHASNATQRAADELRRYLDQQAELSTKDVT